MRRLLAILALTTLSSAGAQEGFPLDGTWRGERQDAQPPVTIVMIMQWDGHKVTGVINPGPKAIQIGEARLIAEGWRVTVAARSAAGDAIAFDGVLGELGSYHRTITGTWTEGGHSYHVRMMRE